MFEKLLAEGGLSLDRLKALLAVAAAGSIVKATAGDPVKQSQYSRQIKELENFFRTKLVERQGKGIRLTPNGKELARISRFFMLGLSNFQRGCLAEEQSFCIGASATFLNHFLLPQLSNESKLHDGTRYVVEAVGNDEVERRLHQLTLDFGITTAPEISRPLQMKELRKWRLHLWVPNVLYKNEKSVIAALKEKRLPLVLAKKELEACGVDLFHDHEPRLVCESFLEALLAMEKGRLASVLPDFLTPGQNPKGFFRVRIRSLESQIFRFQLAWNPRLLRLNAHAIRRRDLLEQFLSGRILPGKM